MRFWICLAIAVPAIAFIAGSLGLGRALSATICITVVLVAVAVRKVILPLADAIVEGHDPFHKPDPET